MSEVTIKIEVNCETGISVEVPLTADEITQRNADADAALVEQGEREAEAVVKADAKAELLAKLGITEDEAKLLLS